MSRLTLALALTLGLPALGASEEWYDAYGRGLVALKQHEAEKAIVALGRAIRLRKQPGENLLSYGTNTVRRYHPYLRLADANLMLGDPFAARRALKRSEEIGREPAVERASLSVLVESALSKQAAVLAGSKSAASAPAATEDAELEVGLEQVQAGDFEAGALILESVARRLAAQGHSQDLARAYLHLGIAYIGLSQQERVRAGAPMP